MAKHIRGVYMKKLKWGRSWRHVVLDHLKDKNIAVPYEVAKEINELYDSPFRKLNAHKVSYILMMDNWTPHRPPQGSQYPKEQRRVIYHRLREV